MKIVDALQACCWAVPSMRLALKMKVIFWFLQLLLLSVLQAWGKKPSDGIFWTSTAHTVQGNFSIVEGRQSEVKDSPAVCSRGPSSCWESDPLKLSGLTAQILVLHGTASSLVRATEYLSLSKCSLHSLSSSQQSFALHKSCFSKPIST